MSDAGTSWWLGADKMWRKGRPPSGWHQTRDGLWHPPSTAATRLKPSDSDPEGQLGPGSAPADELVVPIEPTQPAVAPIEESAAEPPAHSVFPDPGLVDSAYGVDTSDAAPPSSGPEARVLRHADTAYGGYGTYDEAEATGGSPPASHDLPTDSYGVDDHDPFSARRDAYGAAGGPYGADSPYGSPDRQGAYYQPNGHDAPDPASAATALGQAGYDEAEAPTYADVALGEVGSDAGDQDLTAVADSAAFADDDVEEDDDARHMAGGQPVLWDVMVERILSWPTWLRVALPCAAVVLLLGVVSMATSGAGGDTSSDDGSTEAEGTYQPSSSTTDNSSSSAPSGQSSSSTSSTRPNSSSTSTSSLASLPTVPPPPGSSTTTPSGTSPTTRPSTTTPTTSPPPPPPPPPPTTTTTAPCWLPPLCG
jgi:hypothetical protein